MHRALTGQHSRTGQRGWQSTGHCGAGTAWQGKGRVKDRPKSLPCEQKGRGLGAHLSAKDSRKACGGEAAPAVARPHLHLRGSPHHTHPSAAIESGPLVILPCYPCSQPCGEAHLQIHTLVRQSVISTLNSVTGVACPQPIIAPPYACSTMNPG